MRSLLPRCLLLASLVLFSACATSSNETGIPASTPAPATVSETLPQATASAPTSDEYLISLIPECSAKQILEQPIPFNWPNIETRIQELKGTLWVYYTCAQPQAQVAELIRQELPHPPYNLKETNWIDRQEGSVGVYFHVANYWQYVWAVPHPDDPQHTLVVIAQSYVLVSC